MEKKKWIDVHADDFGVSVHASADIVECLKGGMLDSISVIPNMSCFSACVRLYQDHKASFKKEPLICVHLNILDGKAVSDREKIPDLVDEEGFFCLTWGRLFLMNYGGKEKKERIKRQLKTEFEAQIRLVEEAFDLKELRLDSHQHPHMIPFVFDTLMEINDQGEKPVRFVRLAKEPLMPFLWQIVLYPTYSPVNLIKNILLNFFALQNCKKLEKRGISYELLWGLLMSGNMDAGRIGELFDHMVRYAGKKGKMMEILFHPGRMLEEEKGGEYRKKGFLRFYLSADRNVEKKSVKKLFITYLENSHTYGKI